jgi:hypothetical protein
MTEEKDKASRRRFEFIGAIVCALALAFVLWTISLASDRSVIPEDYLDLGGDLLLTTSCYLGSFFLLDRYCNLTVLRVRLNWIVIAVGGMLLSYSIWSLPLPWHKRPGGGRMTFNEYIFLSKIFVVDVGSFILLAMAVTYGIGFIVRSVKRRNDGSKISVK